MDDCPQLRLAVRLQSPANMKKALVLAMLAACVGETPPLGTGGDNGPPVDPGSGSDQGSGSAGSGSGSGSGSGTGSAAPMTATQYLHARNVKMCDAEFACRPQYPADPNGPTFAQMYGSTVTDCYAFSDNADQPTAVETEITANHISYSATMASQCVTGISFPSDCASFWTNGAIYPASCASALRGLVADGDACVVDYDCLNGDSYCEPNALVCVQGVKP